MRIGLTSWAFRWAVGTRDFAPPQPLTPGALLARARALGAEVVQICDNMPLVALTAVDLRRLRDQAADLGLTLEVGAASAQPACLAAYIEIARALDARVLRVVEDRQLWQPTLDDLVAALRAVLPACRGQGVTIALENHTALSPRELMQVVRTVDDPCVGICLDTLNSVVRLEGWREVVDLLAPYAVSLHLKDAMVQRRGVGFYVGGAPLGRGIVDLREVVRRVQANGRGANALIEFWMDFAGDAETTLRQEEAWIADSLAYLRQII